jgi:hypothetical protein
MNWLTQRTTIVGIMTLLASAGIQISPEMQSAIAEVIVPLIGLIALVINDKRH